MDKVNSTRKNKPHWLTFFTSWFFILPILYLTEISTSNCPQLYHGSIACLTTSVLNHGFDNLLYFENHKKYAVVKIFEWIDRIVCHFYILYFIIFTSNLDPYWFSTILCGIIIGLIYYVKLQYIVSINNDSVVNPEIWHGFIHFIANIGIIFCIISCEHNENCGCCE